MSKHKVRTATSSKAGWEQYIRSLKKDQKQKKPGAQAPSSKAAILRHRLLARYRQHKHCSTIMLAELICQEMGLPSPPTKAKAYRSVKKLGPVVLGDKPSHQKRSNQAKKTPSDVFYKSRAWIDLRYIALRNSGGACNLCGAKSSDGVQLHVDHIFPRSKYPEKELDLDTLQVLCADCNYGKSNAYCDDWRGLSHE